MSDIPSTTEHTSSWPHLLGIPLELREYIYASVADSEQSNDLEIFGSGDGHTEYCLPIETLQPPTLVRVCQTLRNEYLRYYFANRVFRVSTRVESIPSNGLPPFQHAYRGPAAKQWLDRLDDRNEVRFRKLQYRFVDSAESPIGASLNVVYKPGAKTFEIDFRIDSGWDVSETISLLGHAPNIRRGNSLFLRRLSEIGAKGNVDGLSWSDVQALADVFTKRIKYAIPALDTGVPTLDLSDLQSWNTILRVN